MALSDMSEGYLRKGAIGTLRSEEEIYDIGPETIKFFQGIIKNAKTIFFNGPLGMIETMHSRTARARFLTQSQKSYCLQSCRRRRDA